MAAVCALRVVANTERPTAKSSTVATAGKKFANVTAAKNSGLVPACSPFSNGFDPLGFFNNIDEAEAQRYADVEVTHGRVAMLATVGFYVGEKVAGTSFLFNRQVTVGTFGVSGLCCGLTRWRVFFFSICFFPAQPGGEHFSLVCTWCRSSTRGAFHSFVPLSLFFSDNSRER